MDRTAGGRCPWRAAPVGAAARWRKPAERTPASPGFRQRRRRECRLWQQHEDRQPSGASGRREGSLTSHQPCGPGRVKMERPFTLTLRLAVELGGEHVDNIDESIVRLARRPRPDQLVETLEVERCERRLAEEFSRFPDREARKMYRFVVRRFLVGPLDRFLHIGRGGGVEPE